MEKSSVIRLAAALMVGALLLVPLFPGIGAMAAENLRISPVMQKPEMISMANKSSELLSMAEPAATDTEVPAFEGSQALLNKADAANLVQNSIVNPLWANADQEDGLKVLQYSEILPQGTLIEPAFETFGRPSAEIVSQNPSWLFMIDEMPGAHFAHPVKLVVVDAVTRDQQVIETEWWPKVDSRQVFDKESIRADPALITFYKKPSRLTDAISDIRMIDSGLLAVASQCDAWAVIVCGFNDLPDTFDEDTEGIYSILKSLGIDDSHIYFLSPHTGHTGVDALNTIENVQWAINEVAAKSGVNDKVLFFYSSHGGVDGLVCSTGTSGGTIYAGDLDNWLDGITCKEMAIIVEACHSGSLIGKYSDGTFVPAESDLTADGETNRVIFTSASTDSSSYPDIDGPDDPNPSDSGSESIYGYIMAFSEPSADEDGDGRISFGEAYLYAWDNDVTRLRGDNMPQMLEAGLNRNNVFHQCLSSQTGSKFKKPLYEVPFERIIPEVIPQPGPVEKIVSRSGGL